MVYGAQVEVCSVPFCVYCPYNALNRTDGSPDARPRPPIGESNGGGVCVSLCVVCADNEKIIIKLKSHSVFAVRMYSISVLPGSRKKLTSGIIAEHFEQIIATLVRTRTVVGLALHLFLAGIAQNETTEGGASILSFLHVPRDGLTQSPKEGPNQNLPRHCKGNQKQ